MPKDKPAGQKANPLHEFLAHIISTVLSRPDFRGLIEDESIEKSDQTMLNSLIELGYADEIIRKILHTLAKLDIEKRQLDSILSFIGSGDTASARESLNTQAPVEMIDAEKAQARVLTNVLITAMNHPNCTLNPRQALESLANNAYTTIYQDALNTIKRESRQAFVDGMSQNNRNSSTIREMVRDPIFDRQLVPLLFDFAGVSEAPSVSVASQSNRVSSKKKKDSPKP